MLSWVGISHSAVNPSTESHLDASILPQGLNGMESCLSIHLQQLCILPDTVETDTICRRAAVFVRTASAASDHRHCDTPFCFSRQDHRGSRSVSKRGEERVQRWEKHRMRVCPLSTMVARSRNGPATKPLLMMWSLDYICPHRLVDDCSVHG